MADITVTIPNTTFAITEVASGISVTTPTEIVVDVSSDSNAIAVTNTPQEITVLTSGTLNINTQGVITSVNGNTGPMVVLDTDDIAEGTTNLYYTNSRADARVALGVADKVNRSGDTMTGNLILNADPSIDLGAATKQYVDAAVNAVTLYSTDDLPEGTTNLYYTNARADARVALGIAGIDFPVDSVNGKTNTVVLTTTDINEGTNLYYTTVRANNDFDTRLATKTTTNLAEGTNLYYTTARANTDFDTRLATKTTTDLAEGTNLYYTDARFDTRLATKTTDNLNEGSTNLYFTNARARTAISVSDQGGDGSLSYDNSTGVITYTGPSATEVRAHFSGGTGVTITNGVVAIGQSVATTDAVTFGSINIDSRAVLDTATLTTSATTADQVLDSFSAATYRTAKYLISITSGSAYESVELLVVHDGTTAYQTTYAEIRTGADLASFSVDVSAGNVRLLTTPVNAVSVYKVTRTAIVV